MQKQFAWTSALLVATALAAAACEKRTPPSPPIHPITSVSDLMPGAKVGVQRGTTGAFYAEDTLAPRGVQIVTFIKAPDMYNALEAGQIQAIINDLPISEDVVEKKPGLKIVQQIDNGEKYAFAVNKENPALLHRIDQALQNLFADGTYKTIFTRYFPRQPLPSSAEGATAAPFSGCPSLSTVQPKTLTIGSDIPYPPFELFTERGEATGVDVEIMEAIAKELCLTPKWVNTNFDTIFTNLSAGRFDAVAAAVTAYAPQGSPSYATVAARQKIVSFTKRLSGAVLRPARPVLRRLAGLLAVLQRDVLHRLRDRLSRRHAAPGQAGGLGREAAAERSSGDRGMSREAKSVASGDRPVVHQGVARPPSDLGVVRGAGVPDAGEAVEMGRGAVAAGRGAHVVVPEERIARLVGHAAGGDELEGLLGRAAATAHGAQMVTVDEVLLRQIDIEGGIAG